RLNATAHGRRNRIMKALVISGVGRYADPWHDFAGTSQRLAELLGGMGLDAEVATLGTEEPPADPVDLLVVNAGVGSTPREVAKTPEHGCSEALAVWARPAAASAVTVFATYPSAYSFYADARWVSLLGGRWIPVTSWLPPMAPTSVQF